MTSNDTPRPDARAGRRRALGRGPGERVAPPVAQRPEAAPSGIEFPGSAVARATPDGPREAAVPASSPWDGSIPEAASGAATEPEPEQSRPEAGPRGEPDAPAPSRPTPAPQPPTTASETVGAAPGPPGSGAERPPEAAKVPGGPPEGVSDDGGDGVFKVRLANFEGPFDLLLQLISKHKMDVTEVALSKVTDEFMAHIRARGPDWDLDETTEFLVVAATLLDLKAARLLPAAEVEDEADLALLEARDLLFARLLQYRAYKQIAEIFNERLEAEARRHPRTVGLEPHHAELLPEVVISIGPEGFAKLAVKAMQPRPKPQVYVEHIHAPLVSVQEQAGIVVARLKELGEASFRLLVEDTEETLTVVARFLALLELYREKAVELDQETALGDLQVRWTGGDGDAEPVVTDEFDRPPEKTEEEERKA
ncbi:segregation/condensation protein A [Streptomyces marokkonensis]|uniref:Segregation and condensation protein A n=1 Tax=Streptomyces marokkonensis TaxID=324855 RepID=A0ABP7QID4_9ACTN